MRGGYSVKPLPLALVNPDLKERTCLMCGQPFMSLGPENRRCERCSFHLASNNPIGRVTGASGRGRRVTKEAGLHEDT